MALQQQFTVSQSQDAATLYLNDDTGDYSAVDNPGGYGTPNTARNALALILIVNYKASTGDEALTPDTYDPETIELWTIPGNAKDGHVEFKVYAIDAYPTGSEPGAPATNDFIYDTTLNRLERWNGSAWVTATNSELTTNDVAHTTVDYPVLGLMWIAFNNINKLYISSPTTTNRNDLKDAISDTAAMLNGTIALFAEGAYAQAQKNIEKYQSRVDTLTALS